MHERYHTGAGWTPTYVVHSSGKVVIILCCFSRSPSPLLSSFPRLDVLLHAALAEVTSETFQTMLDAFFKDRSVKSYYGRSIASNSVAGRCSLFCTRKPASGCTALSFLEIMLSTTCTCGCPTAASEVCCLLGSAVRVANRDLVKLLLWSCFRW